MLCLLLDYIVPCYHDRDGGVSRLSSQRDRLPARARGEQRPRLVQGESRALRRAARGAGERARRGSRARRPPAPVPAVERHPLPSRPADQGAARARDRLRGRRRLLRRAVARRAVRRVRAAQPGARPARAHPPPRRRRSQRGDADEGDRRRRGGRPAVGRADAETRAARLPARPPADRPAAPQALTVSRRHPLARWIHGPAAGRRIRAELDAGAPLVRWLRERVGPTDRPRRR